MTVATPTRRVQRVLDAALIAAFAGALCGPTIDAFVRDDAARGPASEMRAASPMPALPEDLEGLSRFPAAFEAHHADTFGLRDKLLRLNSLEKYHVFASSPSQRILFGADGWLFWTGDRSDEVFRGTAPFTESQLRGWQYELESRARALAEKGCRHLWVTAPSKETIYPERMPAAYRPVGPTRLDQFTRWMQANSTVDVLDLRPALLAAKAQDDGPFDVLYTPHGTHWTGRGSLVAYRAIVAHLARDFPLVRPLAEDELGATDIPAAYDSLAGILYLQGHLASPDRSFGPRDPARVEIIEAHGEPQTRALARAHAQEPLLPPTMLFHDSFGPFVWPLLAASCETLRTQWNAFDPRLVDTQETRIVVELFVERVLVTHAPIVLAPPTLEGGAARFAALPHVLFDFSTAPPSAVEAVADMPLERVDVDGRPALRFLRRGARQGLAFTGIDLPAGGEVGVWIDVECTVPGLVDLTWRPASERKFRRRDSTTLLLEAGRNERLVWIAPAGARSVLMLHPREEDQTLVLRAFGVRATQAP